MALGLLVMTSTVAVIARARARRRNAAGEAVHDHAG